jgi:hypothetical protein
VCASVYGAACLQATQRVAQLKYIHYLLICLLSSCGIDLKLWLLTRYSTIQRSGITRVSHARAKIVKW